MSHHDEPRDDATVPPPDPAAFAPSVLGANAGALSWNRGRTPRLLSRTAKVIFVGTGFVTGLGIDSTPVLAVTAVFGMLAWPLFIASYILSLTPGAFAGSLEVTPDDLFVVRPDGRRKAIARSAIRGALVVTRALYGGLMPTLEVEVEGGDVLVARLADPRAAQELVRQLGFGPGGRRVHTQLAKPTRRLVHPLIGFGIYILIYPAVLLMTNLMPTAVESTFLARAGMCLMPALIMAAYLLITRALRAPDVTIGDDGVLVTRGFRTHRLRPADQLGDLSYAPELRAVLVDPEKVQAVARVVDERTGPSAAPAERFAHYDRGGRPLAAWRDHLAGAMEQASYRASAATVDEAGAVLRSAEATPEQRIGAALALRVAGQPAERIRVAADAAVDDRVREALEAVAGTSDLDAGLVPDGMLDRALRRLPGAR